MLNRRDFLKVLGIGVLGTAAPVILEPERKMWFVPSSAPVGSRVERLTAERTFAGLVPRDGETWSNVAGPPVAPSRARPREAGEPLWCQQIDGSGYAIDSLDEAPVGTTAYVEPLDLDIQQAMRAQWQRAYDAYKREREKDRQWRLAQLQPPLRDALLHGKWYVVDGARG